jgi:hypothetical protein
MGFKFSSFAAGAAEAVVDTLRKDEEEASKVGVFGVKALRENYDKVILKHHHSMIYKPSLSSGKNLMLL